MTTNTFNVLLNELLTTYNCKTVKELGIADITNQQKLRDIEFAAIHPTVIDNEVWLTTKSGLRIMKVELSKLTLELLGLEAHAYTHDKPDEALEVLQSMIEAKCDIRTQPLLTIMGHNVYLLKQTQSMYNTKRLGVSPNYGFTVDSEYLLNALGHRANEVEVITVGGTKFVLVENPETVYNKIKRYNCCISYALRSDKLFLKALQLLGYKPLFWQGGEFYGARDAKLCSFRSATDLPANILCEGVCYSYYKEFGKYFPVLLPEDTPVMWCIPSMDKGISVTRIASLETNFKFLKPVEYLSPAKAVKLYKKNSKYNDGMSVYVNTIPPESYPAYSEPRWTLENWQSVLVYHSTNEKPLWFHTKDFSRLLVEYCKVNENSQVLMHDINLDALELIGRGIKYGLGVSPITLALHARKNDNTEYIDKDDICDLDVAYSYVPVNSVRKW